ncbi:hypothetical protein FG91_03003 [Sphingopyxis sp. LC81]|uniref:hypothetical protein n=1 Tax=Sphingopyxis sp. LC81 TaxID=1502850 RepID=UPI0005105B26|nr:hypothetical protein [Sphingopyxis sp. LC81]KGB53072.1 hypothetical protein FG91_03003 [Sphingopyxis sp. LC81]
MTDAVAAPELATAPARYSGFSAGALWSVGILLPNILSIIFQATQQSRGIGAGDLGTLGAAFVLGRGIVIGTAPFWVYRTNPRQITAGAIIATVAALMAVVFLIGTNRLGLGWFIVGLTSGCVAPPAYTALGNARDPLRSYSIALFGSSLIAAIVAYLLPTLIVPHYGEKGVLIVIAALFLVALPCAWALRDTQFVGKRNAPSALSGKDAPSTGSGRYAAPVIAAIAGAVFTGVFMGGAGAFVASIAAANGIGAKSVGLFVAFALMASLVGALTPSIVGNRMSPIAMIGVATAGIIASYAGMTSASPLIFGAGYVAHAIFATIGYVYFLGVVRSLDFTDRIYVAYPAMDAAAFAASAELAGALLSRSTPTALFLISAVLMVICWFAAVAASRIAASGSPAALEPI